MCLRGASLAGTAICLAGLAGAGCDWRDLDKDAQHTPVLSIGAPDKFGTKDDFGRIVLPVAAPSDTDGVASRFLVSGATGTALALVELNASGKATTTNVSSPVFSGAHGTGGFPLTAIAEIPGAVKPGQVLAAANAAQRNGAAVSVIYTVSLGGAHDGTVFIDSDAEAHLGLGVAAGDLKIGTAADPEYVLASADAVHVYTDGKPAGPVLTWAPADSATPCPVSLPGGSNPLLIPLNRPILIGHFWGGGTDRQIAVSNFGTAVTGKGSVSFLGVSEGALTCLGTLPGTEAAFGQAMVMGDFNGDLVPDLLVGAPPRSAYVFLGPISATSTGIPLAGDPAAAVRYGAAVGSINPDGTGADQAVVGDPEAVASGAAGAGTAQIFSFGGTKDAPTALRGMLLAAHDPSGNAAYGASVNGISFCGTCAAAAAPRIPLIGAGARVLTYFTLGRADLRKQP